MNTFPTREAAELAARFARGLVRDTPLHTPHLCQSGPVGVPVQLGGCPQRARLDAAPVQPRLLRLRHREDRDRHTPP